MKARIPMNSAQKRAMNQEMNRQITEKSEQWMVDAEAMMLFVLHKYNGFGKKRLLEFRANFIKEAKELMSCYEMDAVYPAKYKLKELGIDVLQLIKQEEEP